MKKTYTMFKKEDKYTIENAENKEVFEIFENNLNIEGKKFYDAFFSDFEIGDTIELNKDESNEDKLFIFVYNNIKEVIDKIVKDINNSEK